MSGKKRAIVLGAGVIGLSCAYKLLKLEGKPYQVTILADAFGIDTTSGSAPGLWMPFSAEPIDKVYEWSLQTKHELHKILKEEKPNTWPVSVGRVNMLYFGNSFEKEGVPFKDIVDNLVFDEYDKRNCEVSVKYDAPIIQTLKYIEHLITEIASLGGKIKKIETIHSLKDFIKENRKKADLIINCLGLGAKAALNDPEVYPARGILVHLKPQPQIPVGAILDEFGPKGLTYLVSRPDACILGGSYAPNDWNTTPLQGEADDVVKRCASMAPELLMNGPLQDQIQRVWVGLRPKRTAIRLDLDQTTYDLPVIHCYGHGGSGWTTHWGCAKEVSKLAQKCVAPSKL